MNPLHEMASAIARLRLRRMAHRRLEEVLRRDEVAREAYGRRVAGAARRLAARRGIAVVGIVEVASPGRAALPRAAVSDVTESVTAAVAARPGGVRTVRPFAALGTTRQTAHVERVAPSLLRGDAS